MIASFRYNDAKNVSFAHVYEITNEGPSHTNKPTKIEISFPKEMITLIGEPKVREGDTICKKSKSFGSFETGIPLEDYTNAKTCDNANCMTYECTIDEWAVNSPKRIEMEFVFNGKKASENTDNFNYAIFSSIRINGERGMYVVSRFLQKYYIYM